MAKSENPKNAETRNAGGVILYDMFADVGRLYACASCGRRLPISGFYRLRRGRSVHNRSDLASRVMMARADCVECHDAKCSDPRRSPLFTAELNAFCERKINDVRRKAPVRGLIFALEKDDLIDLFIRQDGKCALTSIKLDLSPGGFNERKLFAPSIDRIDSRGHYTLDNVQLVADIANVMKTNLPQADFVRLCEAVVATASNRAADRRETELADLVEALG